MGTSSGAESESEVVGWRALEEEHCGRGGSGGAAEDWTVRGG